MQETYVVTGASSGIGYALCCHLAKQQKHVIAIARRQEQLEELKALYPHSISIIRADLATPQGREHAIQSINVAHIAGLVNNAGITGQVDYLEHLSLESWHQQCAINLDAPLFLTQGLLPRLQNGGRIINMTTGTTRFVLSGIAGYAITKSALNTFTKYLSEELKAKNILVTGAHPGIVDTELAAGVSHHANQNLGIAQANKRLKQEGRYINIEISAKFLTWLLLNADASLYTGDIIGIYNQKYQPLWHDQLIPSPYPDHIDPP
ncbi:MAG: SDR family NAD(P)-dependent oxidoreductase [Gammaproteobacteria bacterium]|nr:SDR family NAD(P)-dependent oxidoreductase [Gammaproteobacteria bacterium]